MFDRTYEDVYLPSILCHYINSPTGRRYIKSVRTQQVGQANVNGTKLVSMPIPLIPYDEQIELDLILSRSIQKINRINADATRTLDYLQKLENSILDQAFMGCFIYSDKVAEHDLTHNKDSVSQMSNKHARQSKIDEF